ncbi:MAG: leucine-rich repeat domain-containing protein, partial [Candidatus Ornithomonoglobus sp.]
FYSCSGIESVTLPQSVSSMSGDNTFRDCSKLVSVVLPSGITVIGENMFFRCTSLKSVYLPEGITKIDRYGFGYCKSIEELILPDTMIEIRDMAFYGCSSLREITIPDSVTYMQNVYSTSSGIFQDCTSLEKVVLGNGRKSIADKLFMGCTSLKEISFPDNLTSIGQCAFYGCVGLTDMTLPESVTTIGIDAFRNCTARTHITIPDNVAKVGEYTFYGCSSLKSADIGSGVTTIGNYAFQNCTALTQITIPDNVTEVGEYIFSGCTGLEAAAVGSGLSGINRGMFYNCTSLSAVVFDNSITSLENSSFCGCKMLESISLPSGLKVLASSVFLNTGLKSVVIPESVTSMGTNIFPKNTILYVYPGSAADAYAQSNEYKYEYIAGQKTSVELYDEKGSQILFGYSVEWYKEGSDSPISNEKDLYAEEAEYYYAKIIFDESAAFKYRQPSKIKVPYGQSVDVDVRSINTVTTEALIVSDGGKIPDSLTAEIKETSGGFTRSQTIKPDLGGRLEFETANVTTTLKISAEGYHSVTKYPIVGNTDAAKIDLGEIAITQITSKKIYVDLTVASAAVSAEDSRSTRLNSFSGIEFTLYDETRKAPVEKYTVEYPYIVIEDDLPDDDVIIVSARSQNTGEASAEAVPTGKGYVSAEITLKENGKIKAGNISSGKSIAAFVFDEGGVMRQRCVSSDYSFTTDSLPDGIYTVVVMEKNTVFNSFGNIGQIDVYGLRENRDYVKEEIAVSAGNISEINNLIVPKLDLSSFSYTVDNSTKVEVNKTEVTTGDYITVKVSYEIDGKYASENERVAIEIPKNVSIADGSLMLDGRNVSYTRDDDGNIVIAANKSAGTVRFYVSASEEGSFKIGAGLSFENAGNSYVQSIGTAAFYAAAMFITAPEITAAKNIRVSGSTRGNANIIIYDGKTEIGRTKANAKGSWLCAAELSNCSKYSDHTVYAVAEFS